MKSEWDRVGLRVDPTSNNSVRTREGKGDTGDTDMQGGHVEGKRLAKECLETPESG